MDQLHYVIRTRCVRLSQQCTADTLPKTTTMSTQAGPSDDHLHPATAQADGGSLSRLGRQLSQSAKGYFSKRDKGTPTTPSQASTPSTPAVGDVIGNPTPLQRFLSVGKTRKDWDVEFPPSHWGTGEQDGGSDAAEKPPLGE